MQPVLNTGRNVEWVLLAALFNGFGNNALVCTQECSRLPEGSWRDSKQSSKWSWKKYIRISAWVLKAAGRKLKDDVGRSSKGLAGALKNEAGRNTKGQKNAGKQEK
jgi:hypothetical protein